MLQQLQATSRKNLKLLTEVKQLWLNPSAIAAEVQLLLHKT
jgi:hypothetical protein